MAYAESESMALKRLKVALKRKDWQFFDYGIARTHELIKSGTKVSEIQQWYELLDAAKNENIPQEEIQKLSTIIEGMLTPAQSGIQATGTTPESQPDDLIEETFQSSTIIEDTESSILPDSAETTPETYYEEPIHFEETLAQPQFRTETYTQIPKTTEAITSPGYQEPTIERESKKIPLAIFINKNISSDQTKLIDSIRYHINKLSNENETNIDFDFLSTLSNLFNNIHKEKEDLEALITLIKNCPEPGKIITSSYCSTLTNLLTKNDIDFCIDKIKEPQTSKYWEIYLLRGSSSIFWCPKCKSKTFYNNDEKTLVTSCSNCYEPAYPDLFAINSNNPQTNPKNWYHAYKTLTNSENWLLVTPPKNTENEVIYDLIETALTDTKLKQAYIVSNDSKTTDLWKNNINKTEEISVSCSNLSELINDHLNI